MFDQNWLKRYMLSNQQRPTDENIGGKLENQQQEQQKGSMASSKPASLLNDSRMTRDLDVRSELDSALRERTSGQKPQQPPPLPYMGVSAMNSPQYPESRSAEVMSGRFHRSSSSTAPAAVAAAQAAAATGGYTTPGRVPSGRLGMEEQRGALPAPGTQISSALLPPTQGGMFPGGVGPGAEAHSLASARQQALGPIGSARPGGVGSALALQGAGGMPPGTGYPGGVAPSSGLMPSLTGGTNFGGQNPFVGTPFDSSANMFGNPPGMTNMWNYGKEGGLKQYVVMCRDDVEIRASPTYADDCRIGQFLHPGQVIVADERRMVGGSWFLHLADGRGWVFETKERLLVMTEAHEFERGLWHYSVVCEDDVETRNCPTYSDADRSGVILPSGDCIAVDERCTVAGSRFLKLADGRGWVFETKDRLLVFSEVRAKAQDARDFARGLWHYTVVCDDDVEIRAAPTYSDEARTGLMVHPGDCVAVDERCRVAAVWFLRLADGRGWVFETKDSRRVMMQLH